MVTTHFLENTECVASLFMCIERHPRCSSARRPIIPESVSPVQGFWSPIWESYERSRIISNTLGRPRGK